MQGNLPCRRSYHDKTRHNRANRADRSKRVKYAQLTKDSEGIYKIVIDQGGLGLKIAEEMRRRHGVPVEPADKKLKAENVGVLNDELRMGRFKAKADFCVLLKTVILYKSIGCIVVPIKS